MFAKPCPWCGKNLTGSRLGRRPAEQKVTSFTVRRFVRVCPFCNGAVQTDRASRWWLALCAPAFVNLIYLETYRDGHFLNVGTFDWALVIVAFVGLAGHTVTMRWEKASGA